MGAPPAAIMALGAAEVAEEKALSNRLEAAPMAPPARLPAWLSAAVDWPAASGGGALGAAIGAPWALAAASGAGLDAPPDGG
jgi:hypothetical protein